MDLLIATHDQALHAIAERLEQPGTDQLLASVVLDLLRVHITQPSSTNRPNPDCPYCHGTGRYQPDGAVRPVHCHCRCPWCGSCEQPLCEGPCETVETIAERLGLFASVDLPEGEDRG